MEDTEFLERLRRELPRLLKERPELRAEIASILEEHLAPRRDLVLILEEIRLLRQDFNRMMERQDRFEEEMRALRRDHNALREDFNRSFAQVNERLDRHQEILERHEREMERLREDFNRGFLQVNERLDRHEREIERLREDFNRGFAQVNERLDRHEREIERLREDFNRGFLQVNRRLDALGARWGLLAEEAFRDGLKGLLERRFNVRVEQWKAMDSEGLVFGYPQEVEVDVAVTDSEHILIEVKASVSQEDVSVFVRKGGFYERLLGVRPRLILVSPYVHPRAVDAARALGVEIHTSLEE